jgi:hypothetical protein
MPTAPTAITPLPTAPSRADPANFPARADAFLGALGTFGSQLNAAATNAFNNAVEADQDASAADSHRIAAAASANAAAASALTAVNAPGSQGTSTTSHNISTGSKTFTTQSGKSWIVGQWVLISNSASAANYMVGYITAYSGTSLTVDVQSTAGSGTGVTTWNISLAAPSTDAVLNAQLVQHMQHALDLAGIAARVASAAELKLATYPLDLNTYDLLLDRIVWQLTLLHDLVGVVGRAISGGDIILRRGTVGDPSLHIADDPDTGMWSPGADALAWSVGGVQGMRLTADRRLGLGDNNNTPTGVLDVADNKLRVRTAQTPATTGAAGNQGEIAWDANYVYVCVATNSWKRAAIATW